MHATPPGFTFVPGTDRVTATAVVFDVEREGAVGPVLVCKRLGPRAAREAWVRARLVAEGELLARLARPDGLHVPRLVAAGEDGHGPWLVMSRVAGHPVARMLGSARPRWIEDVARSAFGALAYLHEAGIVHADLNPDNVIAADDGSAATILDFGLARWPGAPAMPAGPFRGTLAYAAPELARGEAHGGRADLFALAATLLHVACGEAPRLQDTPAAMLLAAGEAGIETWAALAGRALSRRVSEALVACCAFHAAARPASAGEVARAMGEQ